jgi:hypothetical protein
MGQICNHCDAKHWKAELPANNKFWMSCCKAGTVKMDLLKTGINELHDINIYHLNGFIMKSSLNHPSV